MNKNINLCNNYEVVIDIVIISLLCIFSAIGFKKGMLISLFSILCFVLSIYFTYLLLPYFVDLLNLLFKIDSKVGSLVKDITILNNFVNSDSKLLLMIKFFLHINEQTLYQTVTHFIINIVSFVVLAIIIKGMLKAFAKKLSTYLKNFFILGSFDRFCGLCFGFLKGVMIVCVMCFVIISLMEFEGFEQILYEQVNSSSLINVFNEGAIYVVKTMGYNLFQ